jgi:hypothetical protein
VRKSLTALALVLAAMSARCAKQGAPEQVADAFVDAYFRKADQERAKEYSALGVTEMLDQELAEVRRLRQDGYTPQEAGGGDVDARRGESTRRDERVRVPYVIVVRNGSAETVREADVELASIRGGWKVVRLGLKPR